MAGVGTRAVAKGSNWAAKLADEISAVAREAEEVAFEGELGRFVDASR
jgi:hypothetical protein